MDGDYDADQRGGAQDAEYANKVAGFEQYVHGLQGYVQKKKKELVCSYQFLCYNSFLRLFYPFLNVFFGFY